MGNNREAKFKGNINIMVLVGNGFDMSILQKYGKGEKATSYKKFYEYLNTPESDFDQNNELFQKMKKDKEQNKENWCDFECTIGELLEKIEDKTDRQDTVKRIEDDLRKIQIAFLKFLNSVITPEVLVKLNDDAEKNQWSINMYSRIWDDVEDFKKEMEITKKINRKNIYNYKFVNFNYTSLLDNYIFLDKNQFDPHPYKWSSSNCSVSVKSSNCGLGNAPGEGAVVPSKLITDIIHPHGYQNIPRSMLFGVENESYYKGVEKKDLNRFNKSYWAQCDQKYKSYFDDAELFIIYGMSIGKTDKWWWKNIYRSMLEKNSELIIYNYCDGEPAEKEQIKKRFVGLCTDENATEEEVQKVKDKIFVVNYGKGLKDVKLFQLNDNAEEEGK